MMNKMIKTIISGQVSGVVKSTPVVGRTVLIAERSSAKANTQFVPQSVRMRASGQVRDPSPKFLGKQWIPAKVLESRQQQQAELANKRETIARQGAVQAELQQGFRTVDFSRKWGDIMSPHLPTESQICRSLPKGRLTPPQFREWVAEGLRRCRSPAEAKMQMAHVSKIQLDQFARLPDCVFCAAVKREANEAEVRAQRANFQRAEKIRALERLLVDYREAPQLWFRNRAEQIEALKTTGRELKALTRPVVPAEVVLDDTLWRTSERGSWADVVTTGRVAQPVVVEVTEEARAEQERIARWKKMQTTTVASGSRNVWHVKKELAKQKKMDAVTEDSNNINYHNEVNY